MDRARIAAFDNAGCAALMPKDDRRHVLAANAGLDALGLAIEPRRLAHEEARDVEHMDAEVENANFSTFAR